MMGRDVGRLTNFSVTVCSLVVLAACDKAEVGKDACRAETHCSLRDGRPVCDNGYERRNNACVAVTESECVAESLSLIHI